MAEEKTKYQRGVVIEFDFAAIDGAQLLFEVAKKRLALNGIDLTVKLEAKHLTASNYHGGMTELFSALGNRHDPGKVGRELAADFCAAVTERFQEGVTQDLKDIVKALNEKDVKVVLTTRGDVEALKSAIGDLFGPLCAIHQETSTTYGNCKWDAWRRICTTNDLHEMLTVAVTGSGAGVKAALLAGLSAVGVVHPHTEYQDFGGADVLVEKLEPGLVGDILRMLHLA